METLNHIKNIMDVNVNAMSEINTYTIKGMYDKIITDERGTYAEIVYKIVDVIDLTWSDIEEMGGAGAVAAKFREWFNIEK